MQTECEKVNLHLSNNFKCIGSCVCLVRCLWIFIANPPPGAQLRLTVDLPLIFFSPTILSCLFLPLLPGCCCYVIVVFFVHPFLLLKMVYRSLCIVYCQSSPRRPIAINSRPATDCFEISDLRYSLRCKAKKYILLS